MAKPIGTLGTIDTLTVGGRVFTDLVTLITLSGNYATNQYATGRKFGSSSGYAVTGGKTLTIYAYRMFNGVTQVITGAFTGADVAQTDNDVGMDSATSLTNAVYSVGSSGFFCMNCADGEAGAYPGVYEGGYLKVPIAAGKYTTFVGNGTVKTFINVFGYEA